MEGNNTVNQEQFLTEVFPAEFNEIQKRRKALSISANKPFENAIAACNGYQTAHEKYEQASKKKHSMLQRIVDVKGKITNTKLLKILGKICSSKTALQSEISLEELEEQKNEARDSLKKDGSPSTKLGLVGMALSGGGIRSATFNLGVIQALAERNVLKHVDYLSTVSGGGYIGSCISSVLNCPAVGTEKEKFPFRHVKGQLEPSAIKHLRNNGNFIAPDGIIDWLKIPAFFLRGAMINLCLFLPYVFLFVVLTLGIYYPKLQPVYEIDESSLIELKSKEVPLVVLNGLNRLNKLNLTSEVELNLFIKACLRKNADDVALKPFVLNHIKKTSSWKPFYYVTPWVGIVFLGYCIFFLVIQRVLPSGYKWRTGYGKSFGYVLLGVVAIAILESIPAAFSYYLTFDLGKVQTTVAAIIPFVFSVFSGKVAEKIHKWTGQIAMFLLGAFGPFIVFIIYAMLCRWMLESYTAHLYCLTIIACAVFIVTRVFTDVNSTSFHNFYRDQLSKAYLFMAKGLYGNIEHNDTEKLFTLNKDNTKAPYHLINTTLNLPGSRDKNLRDRQADFFVLSKHFCGSTRTGFCKTKILERDDPHLNLGTAMAISGAAASPNMGTATIKPLVFIMTLLNIRLGYWLLNPNKLKDAESENRLWHWLKFSKDSPFTGVGPYYLFKELLGQVDEYSKYVNITDGGHIENLGIFELLKRRCKYIIACDAEADPDLTFGGLAKLIRYARIDLSIYIDIDLDALRKSANGFSNRHCAFGKIHYGGEETGYLLYIKSSLTGDENEYIREYRSENEDFPHESTGDQFFDEAQFESYRALGHHITDKLEGFEVFETNPVRQHADLRYIACAKKQEDEQKVQNLGNRDVLNDWYKILEKSLLPPYNREGTFLEMQKQLGEIEMMYHDPDIAEYAYQIYPELQHNQGNAGKKEDAMFPIANIDTDKERYRKIFHFCNQQMEFMESVFIALQLDKPFNREHHLNRGWLNLFQRWAEAPFFRWAWAVSIGSYSIGFQTFCEDVLDLSRMLCWHIGKEGLSGSKKDYFEQIEEKHSGTICIADMFVCATSTQKSVPFSVGYMVVDLGARGVNESYIVNVTFYFIQRYYRNMRLLAQMVTTLPDALKTKFGGEPRLYIKFDRKEDESKYGAFFERHGCAKAHV